MPNSDSSSGANPHELLKDFPVIVTIPVQWGEQDGFQHVNNVVYFRWCESARIAYLERTGMRELVSDNGHGPILAAIRCDFRKPVTYPDTVFVGARVTRVGNSSFQMEHKIVSTALKIVVAESDSTLVYLDYNQHKTVPVPDWLRAAISGIETGSRITPTP